MASKQVSTRPQTPDRPQTRGSFRQSAATVNSARAYGPTSIGEGAGNSVGVLEAEYFGAIFLIFLTVFVDGSSSYGSKMLAVMKRGTLATILFFVLALFSATGPNAAKVSKALGALVLAGIFLGTAGQGAISALDSFFKADWVSGDTTQGDSSSNAPAGQQITPGDLTQIGNNAGLPTITQISGIPTGISNALNWLKNHGSSLGSAAQKAIQDILGGGIL